MSFSKAIQQLTETSLSADVIVLLLDFTPEILA